jgi:hypothetical protein
MAHRGSCHCGNIAFAVDAPLDQAMECNCSHCARKGYLLAFVPRGVLTLDPVEGEMHTYRFNRHAIAHHFCGTCGCAPFAEGTAPDGSDTAAINLRCIEDLDLAGVTINQVDGRSF